MSEKDELVLACDTDVRSETTLLSSDDADICRRTGDGGRVGICVVFVIVATRLPSFCRDSELAWRAYLTRFDRLMLCARPCYRHVSMIGRVLMAPVVPLISSLEVVVPHSHR